MASVDAVQISFMESQTFLGKGLTSCRSLTLCRGVMAGHLREALLRPRSGCVELRRHLVCSAVRIPAI